jgi:hypothetical protein
LTIIVADQIGDRRCVISRRHAIPIVIVIIIVLEPPPPPPPPG